MGQARPTTRAERRAKRPATLPARFEPRFLDKADKRQAVIKEIRRRLVRLTEDSGADSSYQRTLLAQEAVFVAVQLETMRTAALEGRPGYDPGVYTQMVNCLQGLLTKLGLDRHAKQVETLADYVSKGGRR